MTTRTLHPATRTAIDCGVAALAVVVTWWGLLGFDVFAAPDPDGRPGEGVAGTGLIVVLVLLAGWLGVRGTVVVGPLMTATALTVCFGIAASRDPQNDGLWPIGAGLLWLGAVVGAFVVAAGCRLFTRAVRARRLR